MKNLAIFYGGKSAEHDISIITAIQVMQNVDKSKYKIIPIYIDASNKWSSPKDCLNINNYANKKLQGVKLATGFFDKKLLKKSTLGFKSFERIDVAINCCHGLNGEDGTLAGLLELNNIPYVGSGVLGSSVGMDKVIMKDVFVANNIPCAKYYYFNSLEFESSEEEIIKKLEEKFEYPIIVKPANLGSSIGINISKNREELIENIKIALNFDKKVIIEEVISNLREINCSVIGNSFYQETSVLEEPKNWETFLDFNEKYLANNKMGNKKNIDITLGEELDNKIKDLSVKVFKVLNCLGVVRIDFLLNDQTKEIYVNEINTIPGSYANYLWKKKYTFTQLLDKLLEDCLNEYKYKNTNNYTYISSVLSNYKSGSKTIKTK